MKKHRRRRFQRKLKYKYMAACIGISLFLVLILTGSYYGYFNKLFVTQTQDYVFNMAEQSKDSLELTMRQIRQCDPQHPERDHGPGVPDKDRQRDIWGL